MSKLKKRIGILTGGGDVPPLNSLIYSVKKKAIATDVDVIGFIKGWQGILNNDYIDLKKIEINPNIGGTILKSSRINLEAINKGPERVINALNKLKISGLIVVGGDDTLRNSFLISNFPQVLISKTIDNDIGKVIVEGKNIKVINYFTLGFPTAAEKISSIVSLKNGLRTTAYSHERIMIVEAMGMHTGWLALASGMGNPDFILIPEFPINYDNLLEKIRDKYEKKKNLIIVIAEGSIWENGAYVCAKDDEENYIIHPRFGGAAQVLKVKLKNDLKKYFNTRNINAVNPSYIYRSGSSNIIDFYWAKNLGEKAVEVLASGLNESIFLFIQLKQNNFFIQTFSLEEFQSIEVIHRYVEKSFYNPYEYQITEQGKLYLKNFIKEIPECFDYGI